MGLGKKGPQNSDMFRSIPVGEVQRIDIIEETVREWYIYICMYIQYSYRLYIHSDNLYRNLDLSLFWGMFPSSKIFTIEM